MSLSSLTSSPGRWLCPWDSSCSSRSSGGSSIHNGGPAGLQRGLGGVLQAAGCVLWTDRTGPRPASHSAARTGGYRGCREVVDGEGGFPFIFLKVRMCFLSTVCVLDAVRVHGRRSLKAGRRDEEDDPELKARI